MEYTLKVFNTGQVTLPKKWRDNYDTNIFVAEETDDGLFIRPILKPKTKIGSEIVYYENNEGFGIFSEKGVNPMDIINKIKEIQNG